MTKDTGIKLPTSSGLEASQRRRSKSAQRWTSILSSKFNRLTSLLNVSSRALMKFVWYLPAIFVATFALTALYSTRAAMLVLLVGCILFAGGLFLFARLIRQRYYALLARMPKINGQAPKRFEFHAVILGVGDQPQPTPSINADDYESDLAEIAAEAVNAQSQADSQATDEKTDNDEDFDLDEDPSAFEMYEVPIIRRERVRKTIIH